MEADKLKTFKRKRQVTLEFMLKEKRREPVDQEGKR